MRQIPWLRSGKAAFVFPIIFALFLGLCFTPLVTYSAMALYFLAVPALCMALFLAGRLPAYGCFVLCLGMFYALLGLDGVCAGCVYLLPAFLTMHVLSAKRVPFPLSAICMTAALVLSQVAIYVFLQARFEHNAYRALAEAAAQAFRAEGELGDAALIMLNRAGLLPISSDFEGSTALNPLGGLSDAAREDLLGSLQAYIIAYLSVFVPSMISGMSIYEGALSVYGAARCEEAALRGQDPFQKGDSLSLQVPPVRTWHLPRGWGWKIGVFAVGFLLVRLENQTVQLLGRVLMEVFTAVFTLQGIALVNDVQAKRGHRKWARILAPALLLLIAPSALWILGCADQIMDIRGLRSAGDADENKEL